MVRTTSLIERENISRYHYYIYESDQCYNDYVRSCDFFFVLFRTMTGKEV